MRNFLFYLFILTAFCFPSSLLAQDKLGYVDVKKVINLVPEELKSKSQVELQYQLNKIISSIAEKDSYDLIVYGDNTYSSARIDLTDTIVERMKGNQLVNFDQNTKTPYKLGNFDFIKVVKALKGSAGETYDGDAVEKLSVELYEPIKSAVMAIIKEGNYDLITSKISYIKDNQLKTSGNLYPFDDTDITDLVIKKMKHENVDLINSVSANFQNYKYINIAKLLKELTDKEDSLLKPTQKFQKVQSSFENAVDEIGKKEGYKLVRYMDVAYAKKKIDITDTVISMIKSKNDQ